MATLVENRVQIDAVQITRDAQGVVRVVVVASSRAADGSAVRSATIEVQDALTAGNRTSLANFLSGVRASFHRLWAIEGEGSGEVITGGSA